MEEAINAANSPDVIILNSDVTVKETLNINKTVNIDLNNHTIKAEEKVFLVQGGSLNLSGNGKVVETKPNYGAIILKGSDDPTKEDFSTTSVGSGVTLEGWSGIFVDQYNGKGYGILVNMNGTINAIDDQDGNSGVGIYVNGNIKDKENSPVIGLTSTAKITSTGVGIYAAGYGTYSINGAYISGKESGLGIKSGIVRILDGTIVGTGEDKTPTGGNNNGINASGTAIQIESNKNYAGDIDLTIKSGTIRSNHSNVIYEYTVNNSPTSVKSIDITGGTFISDADKNVFLLSDSFKGTHQGFISGGKYSSDPASYLKSGYSAAKDQNSLYEVTINTINVFGTHIGDSGSSLTPAIVTFSIIILGIVIYLNRKRLANVINSMINK